MSWADEAAMMNAAVLEDFGRSVLHTPGVGAPATVTLARSDPSALSASGSALTLFGDMEQSGFTQLPVKNDVFTVDGQQYRAFDVQGPDESGGIYVHLTK